MDKEGKAPLIELALWTFWNFPLTYNHWPQHRDEGAEPAAFFNQSLPDCLLLCFFQQEIFIVDILESAVQLRLNVTSPCRKNKAPSVAYRNTSSWDNGPFSLRSLLEWKPQFSETLKKLFIYTQKGFKAAVFLGPTLSNF